MIERIPLTDEELVAVEEGSELKQINSQERILDHCPSPSFFSSTRS